MYLVNLIFFKFRLCNIIKTDKLFANETQHLKIFLLLAEMYKAQSGAIWTSMYFRKLYVQDSRYPAYGIDENGISTFP